MLQESSAVLDESKQQDVRENAFAMKVSAQLLFRRAMTLCKQHVDTTVVHAKHSLA